MSYLSCDLKQLRRGVLENSKYLFSDDFNQIVQAITKTSKTLKSNFSTKINTDKRMDNKGTFYKANYTNSQSNTNPKD